MRRALFWAFLGFLAPSFSAAQAPHPADRIVCDGCAPAARQEAARVVRELLREAPAAMTARLERYASVKVFSRNLTLLDYPEFESFRGKTIEGKPVGRLRGATISQVNADGTLAWSQSYVGEENLLGSDARDPHGNKSRRVLVHEFSHLMLAAGFSREQNARLAELYAQAASGARPFTDTYAAVDATEFFAMATEVWFGLHQVETGAEATAADLRRHHRELHEFLSSIYGPARALLPAAQ